MRNLKTKNAFITVSKIIKIYLLYALVFGVIIFAPSRHANSEYFKINSVDRFLGNDECQDRVALVEERFESGVVRINLIENAEETLDIAYYTVHKDTSTNIFLSCILDAAERGVRVRLILDGLFHNLRNELRDVIYAFTKHPNIELKFYEPFSILKPWTWNNRLHDKYIIVDNRLAIIGGRNIGDKYFAKKEHDNFEGDLVYDRDVVIINTDKDNPSDSVISQIADYFNYVWGHEYSKYPLTKLTQNKQTKGLNKIKELNKLLVTFKDTIPSLFNNHFDWLNISLPTNKVTLIHNPIERLNKEPWCWYEIANLIKSATDSIIIQSPYIIPTKSMLKYLKREGDNDPEEVLMLTNSIACSPNPLAISGYSLYRKKIAKSGVNLYEFQGPNSVHAKSFIFDNRISLVGSFNFDSRSTFLSTETMVVIDSVEFANLLKQKIKTLTNNCVLVKENYLSLNIIGETANISFFKSIIIKIFSVITHYFSYML